MSDGGSTTPAPAAATFGHSPREARSAQTRSSQQAHLIEQSSSELHRCTKLGLARFGSLVSQREAQLRNSATLVLVGGATNAPCYACGAPFNLAAASDGSRASICLFSRFAVGAASAARTQCRSVRFQPSASPRCSGAPATARRPSLCGLWKPLEPPFGSASQPGNLASLTHQLSGSLARKLRLADCRL